MLERDAAGHGTSRFAAGMLAPVAEVTPGEEPLLELGLRSARLYPRFIAELVEATGVSSVGHTTAGTLLVARDADEAEALERELALRHRLELPVERLRPSEARRREPALAPALRLALDVPGDHAVDPRMLLPALVAAVRAAGGEVCEHAAAAGVALTGGRIQRRRPGGRHDGAHRAGGGGRRRVVTAALRAARGRPDPGAPGQGPDHAPARSGGARPAPARHPHGPDLHHAARGRPLRARRDLGGAGL